MNVTFPYQNSISQPLNAGQPVFITPVIAAGVATGSWTVIGDPSQAVTNANGAVTFSAAVPLVYYSIDTTPVKKTTSVVAYFPTSSTDLDGTLYVVSGSINNGVGTTITCSFIDCQTLLFGTKKVILQPTINANLNNGKITLNDKYIIYHKCFWPTYDA
jgi:hypothetical protein